MDVAVVGIGYWGSKVFEEYCQLREDGHIDGVAACDADSERLASAQGADDRYESVSAALPNVDATHVCTGNRTHFDIAMQSLEADTPALVEKPLTQDRKRAFDLVEKASERGQILQTGHIYRFANVIRTVRDFYREGRFGDVYYMNLKWAHRIPPMDGTNVLWDLITHPIDIINFVTDQWPVAASGVAEPFRRSDLAEAATIQLQLSDLHANVQVSWVDHKRHRLLEVVGSDATAVVECVEQDLEIHSGGRVETVDVANNNTIRAELQNFVDSIRTQNNRFNSAIVGARAVDSIQMMHEDLGLQE